MIDVKDNFLLPKNFKDLQNLLMGGTVDWHTSTVLTEAATRNGQPNPCVIDCTEDENWQLAHWFYINDQPSSEYFEGIIPLLETLGHGGKIRSLIKIRANLNPSTHKHIRHGFHQDYPYEESTTSILYVNTNNGWTEFEDGTKVESVANRLVTFPTMTKHSGVTSTEGKFRVVININYF